MSTDLVPVNGDLAEVEAEQLAQAIAELGEQGDAVRLRQVSGEIDGRIAYFRRRELVDAIHRGVWLRTLAEAEMGKILLRGEWPDELSVGRHERTEWKAFAVAQQRGGLDAAVRRCIANGRLSALDIYRAISATGILRVPRGALREAMANSGLSQAEISRRAGVSRYVVGVVVDGSGDGKATRTIGWEKAAAVALVVGVQPSTLLQAQTRRSSKPRKRTWIKRQRKLSGGRWDKAYATFRVAIHEFAKVAGEGTEWDEAYEHWHALEKTIGMAMRRDGTGPG